MVMNEYIKRRIKLNLFSQNAIFGCNIEVAEKDFGDFDEDVQKELTTLCDETWKEAQKEAFEELKSLDFDYVDWEIKLNERGVINTYKKGSDNETKEKD